MNLNYYPDTDSLYIDLVGKPGAEAVEVRPGVLLDFDEEGTLVGIDIDNASRKVDLGRLEIQRLPVESTALTA